VPAAPARIVLPPAQLARHPLERVAPSRLAGYPAQEIVHARAHAIPHRALITRRMPAQTLPG
jgi:hypothetical protein